MADVKPLKERPLSPHLQVYRMTLTMLMSVFHRMTGIILYFGAGLFALWLLAAASGPKSYELYMTVMGSFLGRIVLLGLTWAFFHHLIGGIRHFIWDTGRGFGENERELLAKVTLIGGIVLTLLVWIVGYLVRG